MELRSSCLLAAAACLAALPRLAASAADFTFTGSSCVQTVNNIPTPAERIRPFLDPRFRCSREELGTCMVAYRMFRCPDLAIDGGAAREVAWTELGVRARPPHGIPNTDHIDHHAVDGHDYYMLFFHTDDDELVEKFAAAGLPGPYAPNLVVAYPTAGVPLPFVGEEVEPVPGGRYAVTGTPAVPTEVWSRQFSDTAAPFVVPPFHLDGYRVNEAGHVVRYREHRVSVGGYPTHYRIEHGEGTLLGQFTGREETTVEDFLFVFDIAAEVEVFEDPSCVFDPLCGPHR